MSISLTLVLTTLVPTLICIAFLEISSINQYQIVLILIIGLLISFITAYRYLIKYSLKYKMILNIISELFLIIQIILLSELDLITINANDVQLIIDLRLLFLFFLGIPILIITRIFYDSLIKIRETRYKIIILYSIDQINGDNYKKYTLRKYLSKKVNIELAKKRKMITNLRLFLNELESEELVIKHKNYILTNKAEQLLSKKKISEMIAKYISEPRAPIPSRLETWTEKDLKKYAFKRKFKINIKNLYYKKTQKITKCD